MRKCPACGKSRGIVKGGRKGGGKASIIWDEGSAFIAGRKYSRKEISAILGGSEIEYLPTESKRVVCGCFTLEHNPEAPDIIIPGTGKVIEREAKLFCEQDFPVPIFIKLRPNDYPADNARQRVTYCKRELVKAESLAHQQSGGDPDPGRHSAGQERHSP
jgi:hypothetical protein